MANDMGLAPSSPQPSEPTPQSSQSSDAAKPASLTGAATAKARQTFGDAKTTSTPPEENRPTSASAEEGPTAETQMRTMEEFDKIGELVKDPVSGKSLKSMMTEGIFTTFKNQQDASLRRMKEQRKRNGN